MKIYTKKGDLGMTSLFGGKKLSKSDIRIKAYGTIDELNSNLGIVLTLSKDESVNNEILRIQKILFDIGSILATNPDKPDLIIPLDKEEVNILEKSIDKMEGDLEPLKNFILPSGSQLIAHTHISRTICRRAERRIVAIDEKNNAVFITLIQYINRLSDYLFVLARKFAKDNNIKENIWDRV